MSAHALAPGTVFGGRFQLEASLGIGGLGEVFRALDQKTQKPVAIRILASDVSRSEAAMEHLREQVKLASSLSHKNIARVFGMGKEGSVRYMACEYIEGQSLRDLLERKRGSGKTFSLKGAYNVVAHICNALRHAHASMIHGLPAARSVLINRAGRVKLADFGLVRALSPGSATVERLGDRYAMAPEMQMDPLGAGPEADIYTVGVVLHELLLGEPPFGPVQAGMRVGGQLPSSVQEILRSCLHVDPSQRFHDPHQIKSALYAAVQQAVQSGDPGGAPVSSATPAPVAAATPAPAPAPPRAAPPRAAPAPAPPRAAPAPAAPPAAAGGVAAAVAAAPSQTGAPGAAPPRANVHPLHGQLGPPPQAAPAPAAQPAPREVRIEDLLADTGGDTAEKWLIQKDRLDFGPFSLGDIKQQLYKEEFSGDDVIVDQETGERCSIRKHAGLAQFIQVLERHQQQQRAGQREAEAKQRDKRRRATLIAAVCGSIAVLGIAGGVIFWLLRNPETKTKEKIVYRDRPGDLAGAKIKGIKVSWNREPTAQARKRKRRRRRRRRRGRGKGQGNVTHLGSAAESGGDALLSQKKIQTVMQRNIRKLSRCVLHEASRNPSLRKVRIDFGIRGSGKVSYVKVNGRTAGGFHACIGRRMSKISFPKYDGSLTHASFSMSLSR